MVTYETAKEKLHDFIEHSDPEQVMAIYNLLEPRLTGKTRYSEEELAGFEQIRKDIAAGKMKTSSIEAFMELMTS